MSNYFQVLKRIEKDRSERDSDDDVAEAFAAPHFAPGDVPVAPVAPSTTAAAPAAPPTIAAVPSLATRPVRSRHVAAPGDSAATPQPPSAAHPASGASASARPTRKARRDAKAKVTRPTPALSEEGRKGIATLFDNIRAMASGRAMRTLVFAGAAPSDSVHAVTEGLAAHARRHGMQVTIAALTQTDGAPTLTCRPLAADDAMSRERLTLDLNGGAAPGQLNSWLDRTAGESDLVVLEGPPLADSIDAALLACACDGLVIVADAEVTTRTALHTAAERAQIAGCRTLGVVMNGTKEHMPNWMRRLVGGDDRSAPKGGE